MGAYQLVFHDDWEYSKTLLKEEMAFVVPDNETFAEPGSGHENRNWGSRTALIRAYRELLELMGRSGLVPQPPTADSHFNFNWPSSLR